MRVQVPGWPFPMEIGLELGDAQGRAWAFTFDEEGNVSPKWEDVPTDEAPPELEIEVEDEEDDFNIFIS